MSLPTTGDGNTPLAPEELADLIPNLATKEELNEWERENLLQAREWALKDRTVAEDLLTDEYVRKLHSRMFGDTWKWAGTYRKSEKNLGIPFHQIQERLGALLGDVRYWIEQKTYPADEIAVRFHHRMVEIHPFPNGNGRHARMIADILALRLGRPVFTWGSRNLINQGEARAKYLAALKAADSGEMQALVLFARS